MSLKTEQSFKGLDQVLEYLTVKGFAVSRATLFRHRKAGKLTGNADGGFSETAVMGYATLHLKPPKTTGSDSLADLEDVQREKILADTLRSKAMAKLAEERARRESGKYVHIDEFGIALAQRAMLYKQDLSTHCYNKAPEIIAICDGDHSKTPEVIQFLLSEFDKMLARYAEPGVEFKVPGI